MTSATERGKGHSGGGGSNSTNNNGNGSSHHHSHQHQHQSNNHNHNHSTSSNSNNHSGHSNGHHHHRHHNKDHHHNGNSTAATTSTPPQPPPAPSSAATMAPTTLWNTTKTPSAVALPPPKHRQCSRHASAHSRKAESVLSTDSDIRFTRRKLGDSQRCGCAVIAGFLLTLLLASLAIYVGYTYLRPDPLPERVFRAKLRVTGGDAWSPELADQNSLRFQHKQRDYRERINLVVRRSELRDAYEGSEVLALDGSDGQPDLTVHVNLHFDPYRAAYFSAADLTAIFLADINTPVGAQRRHFANLTVDPHSVHIAEVRGDQLDAAQHSASAGRPRITAATTFATDATATPPSVDVQTPAPPPRVCQPLRLPYCASIGYNRTVYPNHLGHADVAAVNADLIAFRELVDAECFRQAFDFVCRLLQPPCVEHAPLEPQAQPLCREYCQAFWQGCGGRLPERFRRYFDCERFPEADGAGSCQQRAGCAADLKADALSGRMCDGVADCADLSDETTCAYCAPGALYCGRGRACIAQQARCDGRVDCPDGSDERDCLSIAPQVSYLTNPVAITPHRPRFYADGFAVFLEKGETGKLCAEGLDGVREKATRKTVAESLCKSLGYEQLEFTEVRNDTEPNMHYVKVLDPRAEEISFVRTACPKRQALYVSCGQLECGVSSSNAHSLPKMAAAGDWPWHVQLFRDDTHVCDGTLVSADWVLTTDSCFQGQPKATWMAVFGAIRRRALAPWTQRRRIIGMVKSPVEGSTAALIRLETSVAFSNFIRPICLSDQHHAHAHAAAAASHTSAAAALSASSSGSLFSSSSSDRAPHTERLTKRSDTAITAAVDSDHFVVPLSAAGASEFTAAYADDRSHNPQASALSPAGAQSPEPAPEQLQLQQSPTPFRPSTPHNHRAAIAHTDNAYPPANTNTYGGYETKQPAPPHIVQQYRDDLLLSRAAVAATTAAPTSTSTQTTVDQQQWTNCQTLGWSRQRDQLQRVQLQIASMAACENVSIATVNSVCTEAVYQQADCSEEEFAGSPMMCLLPASAAAAGAAGAGGQQQQWALVGVASWRIVCAQMGIERPRMYDKIESNAAWIRDTIRSAV